MNLGNEDFEVRLAERFKRAAQDFDDLQNEMAGLEVGRITRFVSDTADNPRSEKKRCARDLARSTALDLLLNDPVYAAFYHETVEILRDTQTKLDDALEQVRDARTKATDTLTETMEQAARLPDGQSVFRDQDGQVRFEDGTIVDDHVAASIIWSGTEPGFEELQAQKDRLDRLATLEADIIAGQAEIGEMQEKMEDPDNPPSDDDLQRFQDQADDLLSGIEGDLQSALELGTEADNAPSQKTEPVLTLDVNSL